LNRKTGPHRCILELHKIRGPNEPNINGRGTFVLPLVPLSLFLAALSILGRSTSDMAI
jgi:hypothetical protein